MVTALAMQKSAGIVPSVAPRKDIVCINRIKILGVQSVFYTIYKITNLINCKIYIGLHKTKNLDDGYMGSGKMIKQSIQKYGLENFKKEILYIFDNEKDMIAKEIEIVTEEFCLRENTYNLAKGGGDGWSYANRNGISNIGWKTNGKNDNHLKGGKNSWSSYSEEEIIKRKEKLRNDALEQHKNGVFFKNGFEGKKHTEETKHKIKDALKGKNSGQENSQYGTTWVWNSCFGNKKIKKEQLEKYLFEGWIKTYKPGFKPLTT